MVKFRRSLKSVDKTGDKASHDSIARQHHSVPLPSKQAPLKVIKALFDYDAPAEPNFYLSFSAGDYLHVVGRESDTEWYEACNPLQGARGLVPVSFFEQVGKTVRDSQGSGSGRGSGNHDSGYGYAGGSQENQRASRMAAKGAAPVYGVVAYDFKAERPDELDAKEGEAIIVIAQSNPEWFVAKPITRLGGPGLIPVSFIEIKDMQTGQTISDTAAAVAKAGIPKVEEWKKMAAEYKNTSIPLGQIGSQIPTGPMDNLHQTMDRMSLNAGQNGYAHSRSNSSFSRAQSQYPLPPLQASVPRYLYADDKFHFVVEVTLTDNSHWDLTRIYEDFYELQINLIKAFPDEAGNTGHPRTLPLMPGPVQFVTDRITEGRRENLDEYIYKLLKLGPHIANSPLVRGFFSPRGNDYECDSTQILEEHSRSAYAPGGDRYTPSIHDRYSSASHASIPMSVSTGSGQASQRYSNTPGSSGSGASYAPSHHRGMSSTSRAPTAQSHYRNDSQATFATTSTSLAPHLSRAMTATSAASSSSTVAANSALKVKVWFDRDTCVVLRLPARGTFTFADLHRKIMERRRLEYKSALADAGESEDFDDEKMREEEEGLWIEYRDEITGEYVALKDDESLALAVERCEKLTLVVRAAAT